MKLAPAVLLVLVGCAAKDPTLDGSWLTPINQSCSIGITFDTVAGTYNTGAICALQSGQFAADMEAGDADFSKAGQVMMTPRQASCPESPHRQETSVYFFDHGKLVLSSATAGVAAVFERAGDSAPPATTILFGCWTMGTFTAHPISSL